MYIPDGYEILLDDDIERLILVEIESGFIVGKFDDDALEWVKVGPLLENPQHLCPVSDETIAEIMDYTQMTAEDYKALF